MSWLIQNVGFVVVAIVIVAGGLWLGWAAWAALLAMALVTVVIIAIAISPDDPEP